jgi:hypothetical protein
MPSTILVRVPREVDPVIQAYMKDVDRGLLREALKLSPDERVRELIRLHQFAAELAKAPRRKRAP